MSYFCVSSRRRHTRCALVTGVQSVLFRSRLALRVEAEEEGVAGHAAKSEGGLAGIRELLLDSGRQKGVGRRDIEQKDRRRRVGEEGLIHRTEERRVGKESVSTCRSRGTQDH